MNLSYFFFLCFRSRKYSFQRGKDGGLNRGIVCLFVLGRDWGWGLRRLGWKMISCVLVDMQHDMGHDMRHDMARHARWGRYFCLFVFSVGLYQQDHELQWTTIQFLVSMYTTGVFTWEGMNGIASSNGESSLLSYSSIPTHPLSSDRVYRGVRG